MYVCHILINDIHLYSLAIVAVQNREITRNSDKN